MNPDWILLGVFYVLGCAGWLIYMGAKDDSTLAALFFIWPIVAPPYFFGIFFFWIGKNIRQKKNDRLAEKYWKFLEANWSQYDPK